MNTVYLTKISINLRFCVDNNNVANSKNKIGMYNNSDLKDSSRNINGYSLSTKRFQSTIYIKFVQL